MFRLFPTRTILRIFQLFSLDRGKYLEFARFMLGIVLRKVAKFSKYFHQNRGRLSRIPWQKEQRFHDELELLL